MMKKRVFTAFLCVLCLMTALPFILPVSADFGPKPSTVVMFEGLGDELCYGTLLSERRSTGPQSAWDGDPDTLDDPDVLAEAYDPDMYWYGDLDRDAWVAFVKYEDSDGFYFLQEGWLVSETKEIAWTYYPPERFKILLYFPESGTFAVSGILERYAFDTYYTVKMNGKGMENVEYDEENSTNERYDAWLEAERSYDFKWELISFALRMVMTVAVEILIALPFGYRRGRQLAVILAANCGTQIILNVLLNVVNFYSGEWAFVLAYVLLELLVFAVEAVIFSLTLHKYANEVLGEKPPTRIRAVIYALVANAVSFAVGILISMFIPGIF